MDKCEVERNPITLAGVKALGEASLSRVASQMYYSLALDNDWQCPNACPIC